MLCASLSFVQLNHITKTVAHHIIMLKNAFWRRFSQVLYRDWSKRTNLRPRLDAIAPKTYPSKACHKLFKIVVQTTIFL